MTYKSFASLYDDLMKDAPYDRWADFTEQMIDKYKQDSQKVIDLGCGTGEIAIRLAQKGYELYGVDYSAEMLAFAEQKSFAHSLPVQWFQQDLRELSGFHEMDVAISFCDVLNYIVSEQDLIHVFSRIFNLLVEDGIFVFDVHSFNHIRTSLLHKTFAEVTEEVTYIWECFPGEHSGDMHHELTFFSLNNGQYDRFDEYHHQRAYPIEFYLRLLRTVGFKDIHVYGDFLVETIQTCKNSERIFFLARK